MFRVHRATVRFMQILGSRGRTGAAFAGIAASTATVTVVYRSLNATGVQLKGSIDHSQPARARPEFRVRF